MWNLGDILAEVSEDLYAVLGITPDADTETIKKAFRQRALESHPDRNPDDPSAEERFKQIQGAYYVLSDPQRRQQYDMSRRSVAMPYGQESGSMRDFITDFFARKQGFPVVVINIKDMVDGAYPEGMPDEMSAIFTDMINMMSHIDDQFKTRRRASHTTRKPLEAIAERLNKLVTNYVMGHGGRRLAYELVLLTDLGPLFVSTHDDWIACRWEDVEAARQYFGVHTLGQRLNPYSGKWNFGCGERRAPDDLFEEWRQAVEPLLGEAP